MSAKQSGTYDHYDVHNLYGYSQSVATKTALQTLSPNKRSFVLSRSHFPGSQSYAFHWLGDNFSKWKHIKYSIVSMLDMSIAGHSFTGADICGHIGDSTEELCRVWIQLGAFYPFSRSHSTKDSSRQDPAAFGDEFASAAKEVLDRRYYIMPYLYTLLYQHYSAIEWLAR